MKCVVATICLFASAALAFANEQIPSPNYPKVAKPCSPQEAVKEFKIAPGLRIELAACEPQVQSPVAMAFDERGRMWVVEMLDYPNGPAKGKPPEGRIKILEDKDGDGFYETATVFADKLLFANGLLPWKNGVIVTAAPHIIFLEDTDGDGRADKRTVWFEGFSAENPQLRVSHPVLGIDNFVYVANGLRGGKIRNLLKPNAEPIDLSGKDFRFVPDTGVAETISGMGQFGNTFDDWGNRFVCDNRHHLRHIVLEDRYIKNNRYFSPSAVVEDISETERESANGAGAPVYPISAGWTTSNLHAGHFTAACSVHIYRETLLPAPFRGAAFTCEPTGNLVHMELLTRHGPTFRSKPLRDKVEFLATTDEWFRPVFLADGWDGALYVVDMYRAVIEHPEWMPPELRTRLDLLLGKDRGRIWRIVPKRPKPNRSKPDFGRLSAWELAEQLQSPEAWKRTTAQRLILQGKPSQQALMEVVGKSENAMARLHAFNLLCSIGPTGILSIIADENANVRRAACERFPIASSGGMDMAGETALRYALDADSRVRFEAALKLGSMGNSENKLNALRAIARRDAGDAWTRAAICTAVENCAGELAIRVLRPDFPDIAGRMELVRELATIVGSRFDATEIRLLLKSTVEKPDPKQDATSAVITGLTTGLSRRNRSLANVLSDLDRDSPEIVDALQRFLDEATAIAANRKTDVARRKSAFELMAHSRNPKSIDVLAELIANEPAPELRIAAVRALSNRTESAIAGRLLECWKAATPAVRREIAEVFVRNPARATTLLDAVSKNVVAATDLDADAIRRLMQHRDKKIAERAKALLASALPADRKQVYEQYRDCLKLPGDALRGREVFRKNCATCHSIGGIGVRVGPDISDTRTKTPEMLLHDIVDPSAAIDANYVGYQIVTTSGKVMTGMIASETATAVTLRRAENQSDVVLRSDIEQIRSSGKSLMPDGLEKTISPGQMADLIAFCKNWRYLDHAGSGK